MYINKNNKIHDVIFKTQNNNEIFYIKKSKNINSLCEFGDFETIIIEFKELEKVQCYFDKIVLIDGLGKIITILNNLPNNYFQIEIPKELLDIRIINNKYKYVYYFERTQPRKFGITNLETKIFETIIPNFCWIFLKENIFYFMDQIISCYTANNIFSWHYDLLNKESTLVDVKDSTGNFSKFLGISNNKLFILTEYNKIVVLNTDNGSLIKIIYSEKFPFMTDAFMHPENLHIYCLSDSFVKINTESLEIEKLKKITQDKISPDINTILYGIKDSSYQKDYISFTSYTSFNSGFAKWIGLFDYEKEEITWHYELLEESSKLTIPAFESPQLAGNKLYVLDSEKTLHIMELDK